MLLSFVPVGHRPAGFFNLLRDSSELCILKIFLLGGNRLHALRVQVTPEPLIQLTPHRVQVGADMLYVVIIRDVEC